MKTPYGHEGLMMAALAGVAVVALVGTVCEGREGPEGAPGKETTMNDEKQGRMPPLDPEEARVILERGTERPFAGKYVDHHEDGTYRCRQCGAALFRSDAKFDSRSGWPSFDEALPGAVREVPDPDGSRTEIVCAKCGAHLGHVFRGEGFTKRDVRHCVNSVSLDFVQVGEGETGPKPASANEANTHDGKGVAYFAGGCFWGVEYWFDREPGVIEAVSGYMGGHVSDPGYEAVCSGRTGHAEAVRVVYDPAKTTYGKLARLFFEIHDPTQINRQGPDVGHQYRSAIFFASEEQKAAATKLIDELKGRGLKVATIVEPAGTFWPAEDHHQDYYRHKGSTPYCHMPVDRFGDE